ncbi:hypothetical protein J7U46_17015 [Pelomonas sp. V22]|uniref:DUF6265 family protein n=1 Tax=Pelomonas sp. V22 TaxID=2822139 RepID=UPI0024A8FD0B|nr:DUF6265 family protein [Pelomonas sp. V22]MDI4634765.1 hypothetical protein [Pelomonas sp. V22]
MRLALLPLLGLLMTTPALAQDAPTPPAWLAGCWKLDGAEAGSVEQWMAPAAGQMMGMSRTLRKGKLAEFEFLQIRANAEGKLDYVAQPQGRPPTAFTLKEQGPQSVLFENPAHDFPQRISYARDGLALKARIEGLRNGQLRGIDFAFRKIACDGE